VPVNRNEIVRRLEALLVEEFDVPRDLIRPEARLQEDLDIDSIDAVDMIVQLKPMIGRRLQPEAFKSVRTFDDVVEALYSLVNDNAAV
jgi:acyl carrier protein